MTTEPFRTAHLIARISGLLLGALAGLLTGLLMQYIVGRITSGPSGELNIGVMILTLPIYPIGALAGAFYGYKVATRIAKSRRNSEPQNS
jgi:hypothetical protein